MAGLRGNQASFGLVKQAVKGTPITPPTVNFPLTGGDAGPTRAVGQLAETDSNRDAGVSFVKQTAAQGTPEFYVRDANFHKVINAALGATVDAGTNPNYTHTTTPANALPYYTLYKSLGATLYEQYQDALINELAIKTTAGEPLIATFGFEGLKSTRLTVDPFAALAQEAGTVYNYNDATVTLAGGATALVESFDLTITNNVTTQQTDDSVPYDVIAGRRDVVLAFDLIFETLTEYNKFHTGLAAGTTQVSTIYTTSANFTFTKGANNSINFDLPVIAYEQFPVPPNAAGSPVVASIRARAQRNAAGVITVTTANQSATT